MVLQTSQTVVYRGCLTRTPGNAYVVSDPVQMEIDPDFLLICRPWQPWALDGLPFSWFMTTQGMTQYQTPDGHWHLFDYVSGEYYPYLPLFLKEMVNIGTSRKIPITLPLNNLDEFSRHFFVFPRGKLMNPEVLLQDHLGIKACPQGIDIHNNPEQEVFDYCTGYSWEACGQAKEGEDRKYTVEFPFHLPEGVSPSFTTDLYKAPAGPELQWEPAVLLQTLISEVHLIKDPMNPKALDDWMKKLDKAANVPYQILDF